ncbi:MAG: hypothetical protein ACPG4T_15030, partial [Nannocystaceae bacterium]
MNFSAPESLTLWDVVEEHFDEAEFLYEQWGSSAKSALYTLEELVSGPESRLEAHLDRVQISKPGCGVSLIMPMMPTKTPPAQP